MSEGSYRKALVLCPFYKKDDGRAVVMCEGVVGGSVIAQRFASKKDYEIQMDVFCQQHFKRCEVYGMLAEIYEDGEE